MHRPWLPTSRRNPRLVLAEFTLIAAKRCLLGPPLRQRVTRFRPGHNYAPMQRPLFMQNRTTSPSRCAARGGWTKNIQSGVARLGRMGGRRVNSIARSASGIKIHIDPGAESLNVPQYRISGVGRVSG